VLLVLLPLCICVRSLSPVLWSDGERRWDGTDMVVMAVGMCIRKHKVGERVGGQKPETKPLWLSSRSAMSNGDGGWWKGESLEDSETPGIGWCPTSWLNENF